MLKLKFFSKALRLVTFDQLKNWLLMVCSLVNSSLHKSVYSITYVNNTHRHRHTSAVRYIPKEFYSKILMLITRFNACQTFKMIASRHFYYHFRFNGFTSFQQPECKYVNNSCILTMQTYKEQWYKFVACTVGILEIWYRGICGH